MPQSGISLVWCDLDFVDGAPELRGDEESGSSVAIADRIDLLDRPRGGFGLAGGPDLSLRADFAVRHVLDAQFQVVPGIRLPLERHDHRALHLGLPWLDLQLLRVPVERECVALGGDAKI